MSISNNYVLISYKDGSYEVIIKPIGSEYTMRIIKIVKVKGYNYVRIGGDKMVKGYRGEIKDYYDWIEEKVK